MKDIDEVLNRATKAHSQPQSFVEAALEGLGWAREAVRIHGLMAKDPKWAERPEWIADHERRAKHAAALATEQDEQGFRYLWSLGAVQLWSIAEVTIDHVALRLLRYPELIPEDSILNRLEGPLLPFLGHAEEDRAERLIGLLKEKLRAGVKLGVGRFEALLEPFGIGGPYRDNVRRTFLELSQVRNLVVHQNGLVDRRFQSVCPWFVSSVGEVLPLVANHFMIYSLCVDWLILEIDLRLHRRRNISPPAGAAELQDDVEGRLDSLIRTRPASV